MTPEERELIKSLPSRLLGIIFGVILLVNAEPVSKAGPDEFETLVRTNMQLLGGIIAILSFMRTAIDYWLKINYPEDKKNPPLPGDRD